MTLSEANLQAQTTWNNRACGLRDPADLDLINRQGAFYWTLFVRRYSEDDPWIPLVLDFPSMRGKRVLEIGHGMGCDLATAAVNGAIAYGIDLTSNHHEIAKKTLADAKVSAELHLGNAGELPFETESMDVVYSLGVLHHTDNTEQCIAEARRVLKPAGIFIMALYHFWSLPHLSLLLHGIMNGRLARLGYRKLLSTVEAGADGETIAPLVKLYSRRSVRRLLSDFSSVDVCIRGAASPRLGRRTGEWAERHFGWYVVAVATK